MQGQYQPRAPGIAAGQSARTTPATYFDYQGILRTAQPGELRPNYVYQNGVWVQDGYLKEGQAQNLLLDIGTPTVSLPETKESLMPGVPVYSWSGSGQTTLRVDGNTTIPQDISGKAVQSIFIKWVSGDKKVTLSRPYYWGPSADYDLQAGTTTLQGMPITGPYTGGWYRIGGWRIPEGATANQIAILTYNGSGSFEFLLTMNQIEAPATHNGDNIYIPTSWIPYGQTRGAD